MHIRYVSDILLMHDEMSDSCGVQPTKLSRKTANHVCHLLKWLKVYKVPISTTDHQIVQKDFSNAIHMGNVLSKGMKATGQWNCTGKIF
jgi:hypothetical protein